MIGQTVRISVISNFSCSFHRYFVFWSPYGTHTGYCSPFLVPVVPYCPPLYSQNNLKYELKGNSLEIIFYYLEVIDSQICRQQKMMRRMWKKDTRCQQSNRWHIRKQGSCRMLINKTQPLPHQKQAVATMPKIDPTVYLSPVGKLPFCIVKWKDT